MKREGSCEGKEKSRARREGGQGETQGPEEDAEPEPGEEGFPRSGAQMRGPEGAQSRRDPGRTSKRPGLARGTPGGAGKGGRDECGPCTAA